MKRFSDRLSNLLPRSPLRALTSGIDVLSLWRWAKLSVLVGVVVGLAAALAYYVLEWTETMVLYRVLGLQDPSAGSPHTLFSHETRGPMLWWMVLLLPAAGGLVAGLLVWRFAPEARGHGTDALIDAYHNKGGRIRKRIPIIKFLASLFTLGTGGSAGREGPMAQIGAGFASWLGSVFKLSARERRLLLLAGAAGGISALFRAPLGAALWSLEVIYRDDFESEGMFPCLISSVVAYSTFTTIFGQGSLFHITANFEFRPIQLIGYGALAIFCAPFAVLWVRILYGVERQGFNRLKIPMWLKPAVGGLLLGCLALVVPWTFAGGYGWIEDALRSVDDVDRQLPVGYAGFGMLMGVAVAKMLATSLTIGSGGSGGVFAPSLFIGGFLGGAVGLLFHQIMPSVVDQPGAFVLVGMACFYAGIGRVPISAIIIISELFGSYDLLVPLMFAEMITLLLLRRFTLYEKQVKNALESPAHVADFTIDILKDLRVVDHFTSGRAVDTIPASLTLREFLERCSDSADSFFVVRDQKNKLAGVASLGNVRSIVNEQEFLEAFVIGDAMTPMVSVAPDTDLRVALDRFVKSGYDRLPVVDPKRPDDVLGVLSQHQVFSAYNGELLRRQLTDESDDGTSLTATSTFKIPRLPTDDPVDSKP